MHDVELRPHEMAAATLGQGADQLGLADADRRAAVGPRLRDEVQAGDDGAGGGLRHDRAVTGAERWVAPLVQVAGPGGELAVGLVAVLRAQDVADECRHRLGIGGGARAEHEAVCQLSLHGTTPPGSGVDQRG